jgi:5-methyltetrahydrofolate--homocysteine methyltransferase
MNELDRFVVIGENIHTTRILRRQGARIASGPDGRESILFADETGVKRTLPIADAELRSQDYEEGRVKHVRSALRTAMDEGDDADTAHAYLSAMASSQIASGAHYLDVNVDEFSHRLPEQITAMTWLVNLLQQVSIVPLSIDSSNLEIIEAGLEAAAENGTARPMLNSASLERLEALQLAVAAGGPVIVTAAGDAGMPTNSEERVANATRMVDAALAAGIALDQIYIDPLVFPISVDGAFGEHCLGAVRELRRRYGSEIHLSGGMSNVSFGLPARALINDVFLALAIEAGADSGIVDPLKLNLQTVRALDRTSHSFQLALDVLTGADRHCRAYMKAYRAGELEQVEAPSAV